MPPSLPVSRWPSKGVLALIGAYKLTLSPFIGRDCRYLPTCSAYAADAVRTLGAWAGAWMTTARLCRCHPWGGKGYDPAPAEISAPWWAPWRLGDWAWRTRDVQTSEPRPAPAPSPGPPQTSPSDPVAPLSPTVARHESSQNTP